MPSSIKVLFLAATPDDSSRIRADKECKGIKHALDNSTFHTKFQLEAEWAVKPDELQRLLLTHRPSIVHFAGHGGQDGSLMLEGDLGSNKVEASALAELFRILTMDQKAPVPIRCVFLNACYSEQLGKKIAEYVDCVVGMTIAISDLEAIIFAAGFYEGLANGGSIETAYDLGCNRIELQNPSGDIHRDAYVREAHRTDKALIASLICQRQNAAAIYFVEPKAKVENGAGILGRSFDKLADLPHQFISLPDVQLFCGVGDKLLRQIQIVANYKNVHDILHDLQQRCFNQIQIEYTRFPDENTARDNLRGHELTLIEFTSRLRSIFQRSSFDPDGIAVFAAIPINLEVAQQALRNGIDEGQSKESQISEIQRCILVLNRILNREPSRINAWLKRKAQEMLSLDLPGTMESVSKSLKQANAPADHLASLEQGIKASNDIYSSLKTLITVHDDWQSVEDRLFRLENLNAAFVGALEDEWPALTDMLEPLLRTNAEPWYGELPKQIRCVTVKLKEKAPDLRAHFLNFRRAAALLFYQIDVDLNEAAEHLRDVKTSLDHVLYALAH